MVPEQKINGQGKRSPFTAILIISLVLGGAIFLLNRVITASANSSDFSLAESTYPNIVGTRIDSCSLCHTASIPSLNPFGSAYKGLGRGNASSLHMIEALDSDGDGYTNIQEINALTFPGNASDFPQPPTNTPTSIPPTATRTNTSVPPTATRTNTAVPPTNTGVPPTATNTGAPPTATNTGEPPATATVAPSTQPTSGATATIAATMKVTKTVKPRETEEHEKTKVASKTPRPTKTVKPSKTPRSTRVSPTRRATPTLACVKDDDDDDGENSQNSFSGSGASGDGRQGTRCPPGYHFLGEKFSDYARYHLKPSYSFYSRRSR